MKENIGGIGNYQRGWGEVFRERKRPTSIIIKLRGGVGRWVSPAIGVLGQKWRLQNS